MDLTETGYGGAGNSSNVGLGSEAGSCGRGNKRQASTKSGKFLG
jgi:hypothetical protein